MKKKMQQFICSIHILLTWSILILRFFKKISTYYLNLYVDKCTEIFNTYMFLLNKSLQILVLHLAFVFLAWWPIGSLIKVNIIWHAYKKKKKKINKCKS